MATGTIRVEGLRELERAFRQVSKDETKLLRQELKAAAQPVKTAAEGKAIASIRRMKHSPKWAVMRIGYKKNLVYMVPKQKGTHGRGTVGGLKGGKRVSPNTSRTIKNLLLDRAMIPAAEQNRGQMERRVQHMLDTIGRQWERNG